MKVNVVKVTKRDTYVKLAFTFAFNYYNFRIFHIASKSNINYAVNYIH
jgi:hypothetical protein